jgi:hypothetical protein
MMPIYNNREIIGYAKNTKHAKTVIRKQLSTITKGWTISVGVRDTTIINLPDGFIYSIHPQTN